MKGDKVLRQLFQLQLPKALYCRSYCDEKLPKPQKTFSDGNIYAPYKFDQVPEIVWNERKGVKRHYEKVKSKWWKPNWQSDSQFLSYFHRGNDIPINYKEWVQYFKRRAERKDLASQDFIPLRHYTLRADLSAAHFIINRGGSVKFYGESYWVSKKDNFALLPGRYVPGLYVEAINAEGTDIRYEGLQLLRGLLRLKWLSLKGLKHMDNWCLDSLTSEYGKQLLHLNLSNCINITAEGLCCFYRFERLRYVNLGGISEDPNFKLTTIMINDLLPHLHIDGVDYTVPDEERFYSSSDQMLLQ